MTVMLGVARRPGADPFERRRRPHARRRRRRQRRHEIQHDAAGRQRRDHASGRRSSPGDKKPDGGPPLTVADVSNLLPNDSKAVVNLQIDKLYGSGFRQAALGTAGAFNENAFKNVFGFPLYDANNKDGVLPS